MSRSRRVVRNIVSLLITQVLTWVLTTVVIIYLPGYVGAVGLGKLTLAGAVAGIALLFVSLGTGTVFVRDVAQDNARVGDYLLAILLQRLTFGVAVTGVTAILVHSIGYTPQLQRLIVLSCAFGTLAALSTGTAEALRGLEEIPRANLASVSEKIVYCICALAAVKARLPLWVFVACGGVGSLISLTLNLTALAKRLPTMRLWHAKLGFQIMTAGWPFFANALFMVIYTQCHPIILQRVSGDAAVGWYGLVTRLFGAALFVPTIITGAMLPALSRLHHEKSDRFPEAARRMVSLILLCAAPISALIIAMPGRIIHLLHYPPSFQHAIPVFMFFGIGVVLWFFSIAIGTIMTAMGLHREFSRASAVAAALVIPISFGCIWITQREFHNGAIGAAISHIVIESFMLYRYLRALPIGLLPIQQMPNLFGRLVASVLPLALFGGLIRGNMGLLFLIPGFALYGLLCILMRCVTTDDVSLLASIVRSKSVPSTSG